MKFPDAVCDAIIRQLTVVVEYPQLREGTDVTHEEVLYMITLAKEREAFVRLRPSVKLYLADLIKDEAEEWSLKLRSSSKASKAAVEWIKSLRDYAKELVTS